ncbi:MAG: hypothetical protein Q4B52_08180 [Tissierellia bacterium]|nr:hypothetical protein [Tissierellia bacterium]
MLKYWLEIIDENGYYKYLYKIDNLEELGFLVVDPKTYKIIDHTDATKGILFEGARHAYNFMRRKQQRLNMTDLPKEGTAHWY